MRALLLAVLLTVSCPAGAQMFKCVDAKGRTHYTDKPLPGCKDKADLRPPAQPPARKAAPAPRQRQAKRAEVEWSDPKQHVAYCNGLRQEEAWLSTRDIEHRDARLGQVRQALRGCQ